jgi:hypothetical protein
MQMLGLAVNGLNRMDQLLPVVRSLGTRHVSYGVRDKDYEQWARRFCGRWGRDWARPSHPTSKQPGVTFTPRSHPQCKVAPKRRLKPLPSSPRQEFLPDSERPVS